MTDAARWPLVWSTGPLCAVQPAYSIATPLNLCMHSETFYKESAKLCNQITSVHEKRRLKSVWLRRCCYFLSASARSNRNWCGERNGKHNSNNGRPGGRRSRCGNDGLWLEKRRPDNAKTVVLRRGNVSAPYQLRCDHDSGVFNSSVFSGQTQLGAPRISGCAQNRKVKCYAME